MLESQLELRHKSKESFNRYRELIPDIGRAFSELPAEVYKDGALSGKIKRLMAMAAAVVAGRRGCILAQTDMALELGASVEEILEACGVAISLGGTMAAAETTRVVQLLEELGKI
jgi:alkylhydroperoxidase/carboxymuconolactone decarboxylase family protein YurZ